MIKNLFYQSKSVFERYPLYDDGNASRRVVDWLEKRLKKKSRSCVMSNELVSVILPIYNVELYLKNVLNQ